MAKDIMYYEEYHSAGSKGVLEKTFKDLIRKFIHQQ